MRVLVTGGCGFVGGAAFHYLKEAGHDPLAIDDLSNSSSFAPGEERCVRADIGDRASLRAALQRFRPQAVMHFAGAILVGESVHDPAKYYRVNVSATIGLLETLRETVGAVPFLYSSSAAVYGVPDRVPIRETASLRPLSPYGESKLWVERMLLEYGRAYGWPIALLRYFNAAGAIPSAGVAECHTPETHLVPNVLRAAGDGSPVEVHGSHHSTPDGTCVRDFIHVLDLAEAHARALEHLTTRGAARGGALVLNLGTGRGWSVREVIDAARRITGRPIAVREGPPREGDPPTLVADASRARVELGWTPRHSSIEEILESAWKARELKPPAGGP